MTRFRTVLFDCDSTLTAIEGIDWLGGGRPELRELTDAAMAGRIPLEDVYRERIQLVRPGRDAVARLAADYLENAVDDAGEVIRALSRGGVDVHVVSGGLLSAVSMFAGALGLAGDSVHAVAVRFDERGEYAGFDEGSPLTRSHGKEALVRSLAPRLARPIMLVGDGITDLEAAPVVDLFVAYAGVVARDAVVDGAQVVIRSASLAPVLPLALTEHDVHDDDRQLYRKGLELMSEVTDRRSITP